MFEHDTVQIQVRDLKAKVDVVVVIMHWGQEYRFVSGCMQYTYVHNRFELGALPR